MAKPEFHTLTVSAVRQLTENSVALQFFVPDELKPVYQFLPGQYLTFKTIINGEEVRRSYSICSKQGEPLEVGIKKLSGGLFSTYAQSLIVGSELDVMTPQGNFTALPGGRHHYLLIAAGSGITPCLSIAASVLDKEPDSQVTLVYGNQTTSTIMFRRDIGDLKDYYTDRLMVLNVLSREKQESEWLNGRISKEAINKFVSLKLIDLSRCDTAFVCGPFEMVDSVRHALGDSLEVKTELFTTEAAVQVKPAGPRNIISGSNVEVSITLDGARHTIAVEPGQETVLEAAQRAGLDLPFSCAGGMCCTCRCKVVSGSTSMDMNFSLADWEVENGFTLACQTRPLDDNVVLDFDEF